MKTLLVLLGFIAIIARGQTNSTSGKAQPGAQLEHFTLAGGRSYDGIWDSSKSQIHVVVKGNHVANVHTQPSDIVTRKKAGDGSQVLLYSDVDIAEKVLLLNQQNYKAARQRLSLAQQRHDTLHQTYGHKTLPQSQYDAVMLQYKTTDEELANAEKGMEAASTGFSKAQEAYIQAGGKKQYSLP